MTSKYEKAQKDLVGNLANQLNGHHEAEKRTTDISKSLSEMVTQYHVKVVSKLDEVKQILEVIRSTPVEIVATQEVCPSVPGAARCHTPTVRTGPPPSFMPPPFVHSSPTREVHQFQQHQRQQSPTMFQRGYSNAMIQANHDAWNAVQQPARTHSLDSTGEVEGMPCNVSPKLF